MLLATTSLRGPAVRILLISTWDVKCGISVYAENLVQPLRMQGHIVTVLAEHAWDRYRRYEVSEDRVFRCWRRGETWENLLEIVQTLAQNEKFDIVNIQHEMSYCHDSSSWRNLIGALRGRGWPVVVTYHTVPYSRDSVVNYRGVDGVIVATPTGHDALMRRGASVETTQLIFHGNQPPLPLPQKVPTGRLIVCGFLAGQKGYAEAMDVVQDLLPRHGGMRLTIMGAIAENIKDAQEAYYYDELRREIRHRGLQSRVAVLMGFPHEEMLEQYIADHDITVLYYQNALSGYCASGALGSALSASRPVIVSRSSHFDCSPAIEEGVFRAAGKEEVREYVDRLLTDPTLYTEVCERVRVCATSRTFTQKAQEYASFFERIIQTTRSAADLSVKDAPLAQLGAIVLGKVSDPALDATIEHVTRTAPHLPFRIVATDAASRNEDAGEEMRTELQSNAETALNDAVTEARIQKIAESFAVRYIKFIRAGDQLPDNWLTLHLEAMEKGAALIISPFTPTEVSSAASLPTALSVGQMCLDRNALLCLLKDSKERRFMAAPAAAPELFSSLGAEWAVRLLESGALLGFTKAIS